MTMPEHLQRYWNIRRYFRYVFYYDFEIIWCGQIYPESIPPDIKTVDILLPFALVMLLLYGLFHSESNEGGDGECGFHSVEEVREKVCSRYKEYDTCSVCPYWEYRRHCTLLKEVMENEQKYV